MSEHLPVPLRADYPEDWGFVPIGSVLRETKSPVDMEDDEEYRLLSIRRRNEGFFDRETLPGRKILTKTLHRAVPGTFVISRMQIVHGACDVVAPRFDGGFLSGSYSGFSPRDDSRLVSSDN